MTTNELLLTVGLAFVASAALSYLAYTRGFRAGRKEGMRVGISERREQLSKLGQLEKLGLDLQKQLNDSQHDPKHAADPAQTAASASGADLSAEPLVHYDSGSGGALHAAAGGVGDWTSTRNWDLVTCPVCLSQYTMVEGMAGVRAAQSLVDTALAAGSAALTPDVEVDLPPELLDDESRNLGIALDRLHAELPETLPEAQTERVEDPAKPGSTGDTDLPPHDPRSRGWVG